MTLTLLPDAQGLAQAAALLRTGHLVAFPTETVYGLGGDGLSAAAVAAIYAAKGRPALNPLILHVANVAAASAIGALDPRALALAAAFWPGPLTLVVPLHPDADIPAAVTSGHPTVALRVPAHPVAQALLRAFGGPLAGPSANPSGRVSPTTAQHVLDGLSGRISAVLDGGPCPVGLESTILAVLPGTPIRLLRPGGLAVEEIEAVLNIPVEIAPDPALPQAPGQLASHYAPAARLRLNAINPEPHEVWIGFGPASPPGLNLSPTGDPAEAASNLFALLRQADTLTGPNGSIAVAPIPDTGLGRAVNDRLRRAAAPRA